VNAPLPVIESKSVFGDQVERNTQLDVILAMTNKMLQLAKEQQWDSVSKLENERSHLIFSYFETTPSVEEAEHVARFIQKVLAADKELISLGSSEQQKILKHSQKVSRGKQASQAYASSNR